MNINTRTPELPCNVVKLDVQHQRPQVLSEVVEEGLSQFGYCRVCHWPIFPTNSRQTVCHECRQWRLAR